MLTIAVAEVLLTGGDYVETFKRYYTRYPGRGFGGSFAVWAASNATAPYGSFGNGAAMRVSPVAWARDTLEEVLAEAQRSAAVTHNHPEGIKGAQAAAAAVFLARRGERKAAIRDYLMERFGYALDRTLADIRPTYRFDISCQGSVPESILCFLESSSHEDAVRNAVSLGGDSDTMACIAGAIAEGYYGGVPQHIAQEAYRRLDAGLQETVRRFLEHFAVPGDVPAP